MLYTDAQTIDREPVAKRDANRREQLRCLALVVRLQRAERQLLRGSVQHRGRRDLCVGTADIVQIRRQLERQRLLNTAGVETGNAGDTVRCNAVGCDLQRNARMRRRVVYPA